MKIQSGNPSEIKEILRIAFSSPHSVKSISVETADGDDLFSEMELDKLGRLLQSKEWPEAVHPDYIVADNSDKDKYLRAQGILNVQVDKSLNGVKFLDFGCGEGHVAQEAANQGATLSVGYDLVDHQWSKIKQSSNCILTSNYSAVKSKSPYDVVLIYDVLDHANDPQEVLKQAKELLKDDGEIYVRTHPWVSRHGTHRYRTINKAYVHLVFSDQELSKLGYNNYTATNEIIHPLLTYASWFKEVGLELKSRAEQVREPIEPFFHRTPEIRKRIIQHWVGKSIEERLKSGKEFPLHILSLQFSDYVLGKKGKR
jgi:2-polyprenyl-3-methyl-5-hydroxy-6-metoxy-1,4-benzoquinol methylase